MSVAHKRDGEQLKVTNISELLTVKHVINYLRTILSTEDDFAENDENADALQEVTSKTRHIQESVATIEIKISYEIGKHWDSSFLLKLSNSEICELTEIDEMQLFFRFFGPFIKVLRLCRRFTCIQNSTDVLTYEDYYEHTNLYFGFVMYEFIPEYVRHMCPPDTQILYAKDDPSVIDRQFIKILLCDNIFSYLSNAEIFRVLQAFQYTMLASPDISTSFMKMHILNYAEQFTDVAFVFKGNSTKNLFEMFNTHFKFPGNSREEFRRILTFCGPYIKNIKYCLYTDLDGDELDFFQCVIRLLCPNAQNPDQVFEHVADIENYPKSVKLMHKLRIKTPQSVIDVRDIQHMDVLCHKSLYGSFNLTHLDLTGSQFHVLEPQNFAVIFKLHCLTNLKMYSSYACLDNWNVIADLNLEKYEKILPGLCQLTIINRDINDSTVEFFYWLTNLANKYDEAAHEMDYLELQNCTINNNGLKTSEKNPFFLQPERLQLTNCLLVEENYCWISSFTNITWLKFVNTDPLTDFQNLYNELSCLHFQHCQELSNWKITEILRHCPKVNTCDISHCPQISDDFFYQHYVERMNRLNQRLVNVNDPVIQPRIFLDDMESCSDRVVLAFQQRHQNWVIKIDKGFTQVELEEKNADMNCDSDASDDFDFYD